MSNLDFKSGYVGSYLKALDELKITRRDNPAAYDEVARLVRELRQYAALMTESNDLPEVPKP